MAHYLALTVGVLFACGLYSLLRRSSVQLALGLMLLGHASNLLVFAANGVRPARPPLIPPGQLVLPQPFSDPLPQAFVLTAIVINFGMLALLLVLVHRTEQASGTDDTQALDAEDPASRK